MYKKASLMALRPKISLVINVSEAVLLQSLQ